MDGSERERLTVQERGALERLIQIAKRDTGQSRIIADFLLAWWNGEENGGFDLSGLWSLDNAIVEDLVRLFAAIARNSGVYADAFGYGSDMNVIWSAWRKPRREAQSGAR